MAKTRSKQKSKQKPKPNPKPKRGEAPAAPLDTPPDAPPVQVATKIRPVKPAKGPDVVELVRTRDGAFAAPPAQSAFDAELDAISKEFQSATVTGPASGLLSEAFRANPVPGEPGTGVAAPLSPLHQECYRLLDEKSEKSRLERQVQALSDSIKAREEQIVRALQAQNLKSIRLTTGEQFTGSVRQLWRLPPQKDKPELRAAAIQWLKDNGFGELVDETVHFQRLESHLNEITAPHRDDSGNEVPGIVVPAELFPRTDQFHLSITGKRSTPADTIVAAPVGGN